MNRSPGPARPPRYEREIEQVLRRAHTSRRRWRFPRLHLSTVRWDWQTGVLLGWGLSLIAFGLRYWAPQASRLMVLVGVALLLLGYIAALFPQRARRYEKRWRGQPIDLPPPEPSWRRALRCFLRRR